MMLIAAGGNTDNNAQTIVIFPDERFPRDCIKVISESLSEGFEVFIADVWEAGQRDAIDFAGGLREELGKLALKRLVLLGIGPGAEVAQALAIVEPRLVRLMVLVNPTSYFVSGFGQRLLDCLERKLPLGLPLRCSSEKSDLRSMLHRIRCPVSVMLGSGASVFAREQGLFLAERIPNSWYGRCEGECFDCDGRPMKELLSKLDAFSKVPTKRPQKNKVK